MGHGSSRIDDSGGHELTLVLISAGPPAIWGIPVSGVAGGAITVAIFGSITAQAPGSAVPAQADMIGIEDINGKTQFVSKANPMITTPLNGNSLIATASISGTATSGTTGTLTASTAAFPTANGGLSGQLALITRNANGFSYPVFITSNTATQISFATLPNAVVASDTYVIRPATLPMDTAVPIRHYTFAFGLFPGNATYSPIIPQILNPAAKRTSVLIVNNLNQTVSAVTLYGFISMNGVSSGGAQNSNGSLVATRATMAPGASAVGNLSLIPIDSIELVLTTGATAPTSGQFDVYIQEVL